MAVAGDTVASGEEVEAVRRWVRLSCTEPGTHLPDLATVSRQQYVNEYGPEQQRRRVKQLRERAADLRREAFEILQTAREIEKEMGPEESTGVEP
jgi:hypothetical protein